MVSKHFTRIVRRIITTAARKCDKHLLSWDYLSATCRFQTITSRRSYVLACLCIYIQSSITFTQFNKRLLSDYQYPWLLTALHALFTYIGARFLHPNSNCNERAAYKGNALYLVGYAALYTMNIAVSNVSLILSTVAYHQIVRTSSVIFTVLLSIPLGQRHSTLTILGLIPILMGVVDIHNTPTDMGPFWFILLGAFLASIKSVATNILQTRVYYRLSTTQLLTTVCPMAFMQALIWARMNGEVDEFVVREIQTGHLSLHVCCMFVFSALSAYWLNWISFTTNRIAGPLSTSVAGIIKQVIVIWSASNSGDVSNFALWATLGGGVLYLVGETMDSTASKGHPEMFEARKRDTDSPA